MKTTVTLIGVYRKWVHQEVIEVDTKRDAFGAAEKIAKQWGFRTMKSHQTTILGNYHFVTLYGMRRATLHEWRHRQLSPTSRARLS